MSSDFTRWLNGRFASLGMRVGRHVPVSLDRDIRPREEEWETICAQHGRRSGNLRDFVGLSFEYADYTIGHDRNEPGLALEPLCGRSDELKTLRDNDFKRWGDVIKKANIRLE